MADGRYIYTGNYSSAPVIGRVTFQVEFIFIDLNSSHRCDILIQKIVV